MCQALPASGFRPKKQPKSPSNPKRKLKLPPRVIPALKDCAISLQCVQQCFAKSKMQAISKQDGFEMNNFSMRKMSFVEFQEFICRLASATYALDAKVVEKSNSVAI